MNFQGLDKGDYFTRLSWQAIELCYNGMGAEWMSNISRDILDYIFGDLEEAVWIHDTDFTYATTEDEYHQANSRMRDNMLILISRLPWYRYFKKRRFRNVWIPLLYKAVESDGGWKAYKEAIKKKI